MRRLPFSLLIFALGLALLLPACQPKAVEETPTPEPAPAAEPKTRDELLAYLQEKIQMNNPERAPDEEYREKNRRSHFGCLEEFKDDNCRFMRCSPYAFYAAEEFFLADDLDNAYTYYTAAFDLIKQEIGETNEQQKQWKQEFEAKEQAGDVPAQDRLHYAFRQATSSHRLYRNYAEVARVMQRYAAIYDKKNQAEEAKEARSQLSTLLHAAADNYAIYFAARANLLALLEAEDAPNKQFYSSNLEEMDKLLKIRQL